ncbi:MAG: B12-binding domain-containing radical SAM protein, partial [Victivallaceae bacterium]
PIDAIIAETASAIERFDGNFLDISDDLVLSSPKRAEELIAGLKKLPRPVEFYLSAHFDIIARMSDSLLHELRAAGCRVVGPGYESGSDRILKLIGKKFTAETIITQTERLKKAGIKAIGNFMIGQHTETLEDVEATLDLMRKTLAIDPDIEYTFSIMTPFPGSPLYALAKEQGLIKDDREFYDKYFECGGIFDWRLIANLSAMTDRQIFDGYARMQQEYNMLKNAAFGRRLRRITFLKKAVGQLNYRLDKYAWRKSAHFDICRKIGDTLCGAAMRPLEKIELKIRNKSV